MFDVSPRGRARPGDVFVLRTYGGWNEVPTSPPELRGGHRAIGGTLVVSILIITGLYVA